jgi:hypothetical protein
MSTRKMRYRTLIARLEPWKKCPVCEQTKSPRNFEKNRNVCRECKTAQQKLPEKVAVKWRLCDVCGNAKVRGLPCKNCKKKPTKCVCGKSLSRNSKLCGSCNKLKRKSQWLNKPMSEVRKMKNGLCRIRSEAREIGKKQNWNSCSICGYDKHIHIAHIKPVAAFADHETVREVNDLTNLKPLCPNCHWEHDNL